MEISEIDELEQRERMQDLQERLASHYECLEEGGWEEDEDDKEGYGYLPELPELNLGLPASSGLDMYNSVSQLDGDGSIDLMRRLVLGDAKLRAMELRLNHALLQVSALQGCTDDLQNRLDDLNVAGAEAEEHRLLLEAELQQVHAYAVDVSAILLSITWENLHADV
jgi:hypothetical protein